MVVAIGRGLRSEGVGEEEFGEFALAEWDEVLVGIRYVNLGSEVDEGNKGNYIPWRHLGCRIAFACIGLDT